MQKPISLCDRCEHAGGCLLEYDEGTCRKLRTAEPTKYDRLISKSPEELAEWIETIVSCERCPIRDREQKIRGSCVGERYISRASCALKWLVYLKQEAQDGV